MSGLGWFFSGTAGNGTSLIAFCLYTTFFAKVVVDFVICLISWINGGKGKLRVNRGTFTSLILAILVTGQSDVPDPITLV